MKMWLSAVVVVLISSQSVFAEPVPSTGTHTPGTQVTAQPKPVPAYPAPVKDLATRQIEALNACLLAQGISSVDSKAK